MIAKIQNCNPKEGFVLGNAAEIFLYNKYLYWKQGISTKVFREEYSNDVHDIIDIKNAIADKGVRESKIIEAINSLN